MRAARPAPDVAIIGGGIVGCALAAFLAVAGRRVRLYEASDVAAGASGRNSGIVQHPFDPVLAALYRTTVQEYRALAADPATTFAIPSTPAGLLLVGGDAGLARKTAEAWAAEWPAVRAEVVAGAALRNLEPTLAADLAACRLDIGYPVAPGGATMAFADRARRLGAEILVGHAARPAIVADRVTGVLVGNRFEPAGSVVVAAGPWTPAALDPSGGWRPIRPSWGVVASIALDEAPRHGLEAIDIDIEPSADGEPGEPSTPTEGYVDFSLVPGDGSSALGSTFLPVEPDPTRWVESLRSVGARYVPRIATARVLGVRHCARPVSRDGRPLLGPAAWADGLWIAAGHGPWGISTGPGSARLLADALLGRGSSAAIPAELAVDRFGAPAASSAGRV